jgi:hypothetical protein
VKIYDLNRTEGIPSSYEDYLTHKEVSEILRRTSRGEIAGYPILDGTARTNRAISSWSLFLLANPAWLGPGSSEKIRFLFESYLAFARAIGGRHAAVWFGKMWPKDPSSETDLAHRIDTERCASYYEKLRLSLKRSPHVLVTTRHPDRENSLEGSVILELNRLKPDSTIALLTELGTQLLQARLDGNELASQERWLRWRDLIASVYAGLGSIAQRARFTFRTGVIDVTIPPAKQTRTLGRPKEKAKKKKTRSRKDTTKT